MKRQEIINTCVENYDTINKKIRGIIDDITTGYMKAYLNGLLDLTEGFYNIIAGAAHTTDKDGKDKIKDSDLEKETLMMVQKTISILLALESKSDDVYEDKSNIFDKSSGVDVDLEEV